MLPRFGGLNVIAIALVTGAASAGFAVGQVNVWTESQFPGTNSVAPVESFADDPVTEPCARPSGPTAPRKWDPPPLSQSTMKSTALPAMLPVAVPPAPPIPVLLEII